MAGLYEISRRNGFDPYAAFSRSDVPDNINGYRIGSRLDFMCHVAGDIISDRSGLGSRNETVRFLKWVDQIRPDIIHLHNIHGFYINIELLFAYIKKNNIPVIWTLHDCWTMTGHCAYFDYIGCEKWESGCDHCPQHLESYPYSITDHSKRNYYRKKKAFTGVGNMTIVTPSRWLADIVKKSYLREYQVRVIPNGIDTDRFRVLDNETESTQEKRYIILGVANVWTKRKGLQYFEQLAEVMDASYVIYLVGVSRRQQKMLQSRYEDRIITIQHTDSQEELVQLYNEALCYVNPTLEDNFPTTNLKSMACGTPVITFRTGGSPEALDSSCGYVAEKGNINEIYNVIRTIANNGKDCYTDKCRIKLQYSREARFCEYMELYRSVAAGQESIHTI